MALKLRSPVVGRDAIQGPHSDPIAELVHGAACATPLGWLAVAARGSIVVRVRLGAPDWLEAWRQLGVSPEREAARSDSVRDVLARLAAVVRGEPDELTDIEIDDSEYTPFRRRVITHCRRIGWGETRSYAELARAAGSPAAARAVGRCMALNPVPLIVPCHRVLGSNGSLGGFSMGDGLPLKRRLLDQEGVIPPR